MRAYSVSVNRWMLSSVNDNKTDYVQKCDREFNNWQLGHFMRDLRWFLEGFNINWTKGILR